MRLVLLSPKTPVSREVDSTARIMPTASCYTS